jgi:Flp pilus assembly protein TadD
MEGLAEAMPLAQRAFFVTPSAEAADTLGWLLVRGGDPRQALPLLRQAAALLPSDAGVGYRFAFALNASGDRAEALRVLTPLLAANPAFRERAEAERLQAELSR